MNADGGLISVHPCSSAVCESCLPGKTFGRVLTYLKVSPDFSFNPANLVFKGFTVPGPGLGTHFGFVGFIANLEGSEIGNPMRRLIHPITL